MEKPLPLLIVKHLVFQFIRQVEAAKRQAEVEQKDYDELLEWLDQADDILKIVNRPVHDRNKEYKVSKQSNWYGNLAGIRSS